MGYVLAMSSWLSRSTFPRVGLAANGEDVHAPVALGSWHRSHMYAKDVQEANRTREGDVGLASRGLGGRVVKRQWDLLPRKEIHR